MLHSLYRCIRWYLWSTTFPGTQWNRIPYSLPSTHIHWYWNYYLQGAEIIVRNDHKPLAWFLKRKNANNKVNRWGLKLATYNITFVWISGACNKADFLSHLVELPQNRPTTINMLSAAHSDGPAFNTRSRTAQQSSPEDSTSQTDAVAPDVTDAQSTTPKPLITDRLEALL